MVALRSSVLALIRRTGQKPTAARPAYAARPKAAIKLLLSSCIELPWVRSRALRFDKPRHPPINDRDYPGP